MRSMTDRKLHLIGTVFGLAALVICSTPLLADHPSELNEDCGDAVIESKALKRNFFFYKDIGARIKVKNKQKKRRWWCLWICKTRGNKKADTIAMGNQYFFSHANSVAVTTNERICSDTKSCRLKETAVGIGVKFPRLRVQTLGGDILPIDGVLSESTVTVDGENCFIPPVAAGLHHPEEAFRNKRRFLIKPFIRSVSFDLDGDDELGTELESSAGAGLGIEWRPNDLIGVDLGLSWTSHTLRGVDGQFGEVDYVPVVVSPRIYLWGNDRTEIYLGPSLGYSFFDGESGFESGLVYGATAGLKLRLQSRLSVDFSLDSHSFDERVGRHGVGLDATTASLAINYRIR